MANLSQKNLIISDRLSAVAAGAHLWICSAEEDFAWFQYFMGKLHASKKDQELISRAQVPLTFISPLRLSCERLVFLNHAQQMAFLSNWQWPHPSLVLRFFVKNSWQDLIQKQVSHPSHWSLEWVQSEPIL